METKEQLLKFFLSGHISLSQYDYKFMANLFSIIDKKRRITSNQALLFDKLVSKYARQLNKHGFTKEKLDLVWATPVLPSTEEYTGAYVSLDSDDTLIIRVPFNKKFISVFSKMGSFKDNYFFWDSVDKVYKASFSSISLKTAYKVLPKFFTPVNYADELKGLIDELKEFENYIWDPTLMKINGNVFLIAGNEPLYKVLQEVGTDPTPETYYKLSMAGIKIHDSMVKDDPALRFASSTTVTFDTTELGLLEVYLDQIGEVGLVLQRSLGFNSRNLRDKLVELTNKNSKITLHQYGNGTTMMKPTIVVMWHQTSTGNAMSGTNISKTVVIKDSTPIEVK